MTKNINSLNLKLNIYSLGNFLKLTLFSNVNYIPSIQNIKFYLYSLLNNFEIISRFFMAFYIIVVDFTDYIITNYLLKDFYMNFYLKKLNFFKKKFVLSVDIFLTYCIISLKSFSFAFVFNNRK